MKPPILLLVGRWIHCTGRRNYDPLCLYRFIRNSFLPLFFSDVSFFSISNRLFTDSPFIWDSRAVSSMLPYNLRISAFQYAFSESYNLIPTYSWYTENEGCLKRIQCMENRGYNPIWITYCMRKALFKQNPTSRERLGFLNRNPFFIEIFLGLFEYVLFVIDIKEFIYKGIFSRVARGSNA